MSVTVPVTLHAAGSLPWRQPRLGDFGLETDEGPMQNVVRCPLQEGVECMWGRGRWRLAWC